MTEHICPITNTSWSCYDSCNYPTELKCIYHQYLEQDTNMTNTRKKSLIRNGMACKGLLDLEKNDL